MTIEPIGSAGVALYLTPADLKERGLSPQDITLEQALQLARSAFREAGIQVEGGIEIEAFPDVCGLLVFARVRPAESVWYSFDGLEPVLDAAHALAGEWPPATLALWEGRYWLRLEEASRRVMALLSEFGRAEPSLPHQDARLAEHGRMLIDGDALAVLVHHFG